jgi:hypothetical protein
MNAFRPEPVEGLSFDKLSTNGVADKSGRINSLHKLTTISRAYEGLCWKFWNYS